MKKRNLVIFSLFFSLFFLKNNEAKAEWGTTLMIQAVYVQEQIAIQIRISMNASAKMFAIVQAQATIQAMLNSGSGEPNYIKNYQQFLVEDPQNQALMATEGFLESTVLGGRAENYELSNVESEGADGKVFKKNYYEYLRLAGKSGIINGKNLSVNLEGCSKNFLSGNDNNMFSDGNMVCFSIIMGNTENLPAGIAALAEAKYAQNVDEAKEIAKVQASGGGVLPILDENGNVKLPKALVESLQIKGVTMPLDAITNGDNSSVFSNLIQTLAMKIITQAVNNGLGEEAIKAQGNYSRSSSKYSKQHRNASEQHGPGLDYDKDLFYQSL